MNYGIVEIGVIRTHGSSKTTVDLENGEFVKVGGGFGLWEVSIGDDLVIGGWLDAIPVAVEKMSYTDEFGQ